MGVEVEEISTSSHGEEIDPKVLDIAMKIAEKMFLKIKEEDNKRKIEEEAKSKAELEAKKRAEEESRDKGKKGMELNEELLESLVTKVMKKMNIESSSSKHDPKGDEFHRVHFDYHHNFIPNFSSAPLGKLLTLSELNYDEWADKMKSHLIGVHPSHWKIMNIGVNNLMDGEEMTPEMLQDLHRNAQAVSIIKGTLSAEEYRKVQGREDAKVIWDILKMSHEGDPKAKRQRIESLKSELARYDWIKGESLQSLFDRLMVLVNKI